MLFTSLVAPILAGLTLVEAQLDFGKVYSVKPALSNAKPVSTSSVYTNSKSKASSILSSLSSAHAAGQKKATTTKSLAKTSAKTSVKAKTTAKAAGSQKKIVTTTKTIIKTTTKKTTTTSKKAAATTKKGKAKRAATTTTSAQTCTVSNQLLYSYIPTPNTPAGFYADTNITSQAAAQWLPPAGYSTSFINYMGSNWAQLVGNYKGYRLPGSFNTTTCATICNGIPGCVAFNIFFERTPVYVPNNTTCRNPVSAVDVQCSFYGNFIYNNTATNYGLYEYDFVLLTAASNGYNLNAPPAAVANYTGPTALVGAVNPTTASAYYLTYQFYSTYNVQTCANLCAAWNANARKSATGSTYTPCNYFNPFNVTYNGQFQGMYCQLFSDDNAAAYGNLASTNSNGVTYNLTYSYGYGLYPQDTGSTKVTWAPAPTGSAATCSSLATNGIGSTILDYNQANYTLACGYDVSYKAYTSDIGNSYAQDYYSCFNLCDNFSGCSAFSWLANTDGSGTCYFKNMTNSPVTPQVASGVDFAWLTNKYSGFSASTQAQTVSFTTFTTAWTGTYTTTVTSVNGLKGSVIIETPGSVAAATTTVTVTSAVDSGTAAAPITAYVTGAGAGISATVTALVTYPTPVTTCGNGGAAYAAYSNSWPGGQNTNNYPLFTPEAYKTVLPSAGALTAIPSTITYTTSSKTSTKGSNGRTTTNTVTYTTTSLSTPAANPTGVTNYIAEANSVNNGVQVYGIGNIDATLLVLDHTFYLYAGRGTGYYGFNLPYADDITLLWVGPKALSGWNRSNVALSQYWNGYASSSVTISYYLTQGTYTAVRVMSGNGGGDGALQFNIYAPDGSTMISSNGNAGFMSPDVVTSPCSTSNGAAFPAWGSET